jgi:hypothetical protein
VTGDRNQPPDIVEQGGRRFTSLNWSLPNWSPKWRPPRSAAILLAVGLVAGLVLGYAAGYRQAPRSASPPPPVSTSLSPAPALEIISPAAPPPLAGDSPVLTQSTGTCSAQAGREVQLGVEVTNQSPAEVTLGQVHPVLPLGGLKPLSQQWAQCGAHSAGQKPSVLAPGASTWFTATFEVLAKCPGPYPVQFTIDYTFGGRPGSEIVPGFPDLGHVAYAGCPAA